MLTKLSKKQALTLSIDELPFSDSVQGTMRKHGVKTVEALGKPFDPQWHEAVATVESGQAKDGTVVDELQRGYELNGRLIRPSRVRIAQKTKN